MKSGVKSGKGFNGDKKEDACSFLGKAEKRLIDRYVRSIPKWVKSYHLTLMTIPLSAGAILAGYLASININWLWLFSLIFFLQWFTDSFDGTLGRVRRMGIPRWGFYVDHLLDYVFGCSIGIGYMFLLPPEYTIIPLVTVMIWGVLLASTFLSCALKGALRISFFGVGTTEIRLFFIMANTFVIYAGMDYTKVVALFALLMVSSFTVFKVLSTQKDFWNMDWEKRRNSRKRKEFRKKGRPPQAYQKRKGSK